MFKIFNLIGFIVSIYAQSMDDLATREDIVHQLKPICYSAKQKMLIANMQQEIASKTTSREHGDDFEKMLKVTSLPAYTSILRCTIISSESIEFKEVCGIHFSIRGKIETWIKKIAQNEKVTHSLPC